MKPHQRSSLEQFSEDVRSTLESLEFRADQGAYREGSLCAVEVVATRASGRAYCDLELRIIPAPSVGRPVPGLVEGALQAFDKAAADPDQRVRRAARQSRRRLRLRHLPDGALKDWPILLRGRDGPDPVLAFALTDKLGRAAFSGVPTETICRIQCRMGPPTDTSGAAGESLDRPEPPS